MKFFAFILLLVGSVYSGYSQQIGIEQVITGVTRPVEITHANDDRLFIVEKQGRIRIFENNNLLATPFLNITSLVDDLGERGLLGLAFHPDFQTNNTYFVHYSNNSGDTVIAKFVASGNTTNTNTQTIILEADQPFSNHNGGTIAFGDDGYLYIALGDGGSGGDPQDNGQDGTSFLGKILRIDVDSNSTYSIPADNPFIEDEGIDNEIFALGLRNPWKFSFDNNGDIWIADVGQNSTEEINHESNASGLNFGWRCYEGNGTFNTSGCLPQSNYTFPLAVYALSTNRCSITGGYVYRGTEYPNLVGKYLFGDYCSGEIGMLDPNSSSITWTDSFNINISTFGVDNNNNMYVADLFGNTVYKIVDESLSTVEQKTKQPKVEVLTPTKDKLIVNSDQIIESYTIYNFEGKVSAKGNVNRTKIETSINLPKGIYLLNLKFENSTTTKKLIIE